MNEIKETKIQTPNGEKIIDNFANNFIQVMNEALADKDKKIKELEIELDQWKDNYAKLKQPLTNSELLKELAQRIVGGQLELDKPRDLTEEGKTPEQIVAHLKNKMNLYNQDGYAWCNIHEIYDEKTNRNPLNLNYFIAEIKQELQKQKDKKEPIILFNEYEKNGSPKLTKIQETMSLTKVQGILTSQIRSRKSSDTPYMAFFRPDNSNEKHTSEECEATKCKDCEIPVVFRIKQDFWQKCSLTGMALNLRSKYIKPNISKGDLLELEGEFARFDHSKRASFTCYSYKIISHE